MKNRPTRSSIEELRRTDRSVTPGTLEGRIGEARPIYHFSTEFIEDTSSSENEVETPEVLFFNESFVWDGNTSQTVILKFLPIDFSEHLYWGGVYQRGTFWQRGEGSQIVTISDPIQQMKAGDILTFEYSYDPHSMYGDTEIASQPTPAGVIIAWTDSNQNFLATFNTATSQLKVLTNETSGLPSDVNSSSTTWHYSSKMGENRIFIPMDFTSGGTAHRGFSIDTSLNIGSINVVSQEADNGSDSGWDFALDAYTDSRFSTGAIDSGGTFWFPWSHWGGTTWSGHFALTGFDSSGSITDHTMDIISLADGTSDPHGDFRTWRGFDGSQGGGGHCIVGGYLYRAGWYRQHVSRYNLSTGAWQGMDPNYPWEFKGAVSTGVVFYNASDSKFYVHDNATVGWTDLIASHGSDSPINPGGIIASWTPTADAGDSFDPFSYGTIIGDKIWYGAKPPYSSTPPYSFRIWSLDLVTGANVMEYEVPFAYFDVNGNILTDDWNTDTNYWGDLFSGGYGATIAMFNG